MHQKMSPAKRWPFCFGRRVFFNMSSQVIIAAHGYYSTNPYECSVGCLCLQYSGWLRGIFSSKYHINSLVYFAKLSTYTIVFVDHSDVEFGIAEPWQYQDYFCTCRGVINTHGTAFWIYRGYFSPMIDTHSSPVRARYGCLSWVLSLTDVLSSKLLCWVQYRVILYRDISGVYSIDYLGSTYHCFQRGGMSLSMTDGKVFMIPQSVYELKRCTLFMVTERKTILVSGYQFSKGASHEEYIRVLLLL